jgi:hypothetical protein
MTANGALPFDDALDAAIDALQRGRPLDAVVSDHGRTGAMLRPLLETADAARRSITRPPLSRALEHNYAIVRAAVERAQMAAAAQAGNTDREATRPAPYWKRRLGFASLSLPVGALALALTVGAAGATASLVATDHGGVLGEIVSPVVPDRILPSALVHDDHDARGAAPAANNDEAPGQTRETPRAENRPQEVTVDGVVSDVNGNTFTLTDGDDEYHVQIDGNTDVEGEILEGATAEVTGDMTAEKNVHATDVSAEGGTPADRGKPEDKGKPEDTGQPEDPGQPGDPSGSENHPDGPPGQSDDPPGSRSEGGGNGNGNNNNNSNNGNGGGPKKP